MKKLFNILGIILGGYLLSLILIAAGTGLQTLEINSSGVVQNSGNITFPALAASGLTGTVPHSSLGTNSALASLGWMFVTDGANDYWTNDINVIVNNLVTTGTNNITNNLPGGLSGLITNNGIALTNLNAASLTGYVPLAALTNLEYWITNGASPNSIFSYSGGAVGWLNTNYYTTWVNAQNYVTSAVTNGLTAWNVLTNGAANGTTLLWATGTQTWGVMTNLTAALPLTISGGVISLPANLVTLNTNNAVNLTNLAATSLTGTVASANLGTGTANAGSALLGNSTWGVMTNLLASTGLSIASGSISVVSYLTEWLNIPSTITNNFQPTNATLTAIGSQTPTPLNLSGGTNLQSTNLFTVLTLITNSYNVTAANSIIKSYGTNCIVTNTVTGVLISLFNENYNGTLVMTNHGAVFDWPGYGTFTNSVTLGARGSSSNIWSGIQ